MASIHIRTKPSTAYITDGGCNYYLDVEMLCVCKQLFLVTKKGALRDTDTIHLFRYSRTRNRLRYNDKQIQYRRTRTGWQIPMRKNGSPAINLVMHKISSDEAVSFHIEKIAAVKDVWYVEDSKGDSLADICADSISRPTGEPVLYNNKLGLRIKRGGEWISDYICFMYRYSVDTNANESGEKQIYSSAIGRWTR